MSSLGLHLQASFEDKKTEEGIALEAARKSKDSKTAYIVLTDTKTRFSKISRWVTGDPYNHVSISFESDYEPMYTYALVNKGGLKGGFKKETTKILKGAHYLVYSIELTQKQFTQVRARVVELEANLGDTRYNHLGLFNAVFRKNIFQSRHKAGQVCSEFVATLLENVGIEILDGRDASIIRPYEFIQTKLLDFVEEGRF